MFESFLADEAADALSDFARTIVIAGPKCDVSDIIIDVATKPHRPSGLPIGKNGGLLLFSEQAGLKDWDRWPEERRSVSIPALQPRECP